MSFNGTSLQEAIRISEAAFPFRRGASPGFGGGSVASEIPESSVLPELPATHAQTAALRLGENPDESCSLSVMGRTETGKQREEMPRSCHTS